MEKGLEPGGCNGPLSGCHLHGHHPVVNSLLAIEPSIDRVYQIDLLTDRKVVHRPVNKLSKVYETDVHTSSG